MIMKTTNLLTIAILFALHSCNSGEKSNAQKVRFGIYETVKVKEIPNSIIEMLKTTNIQFEKDKQLPIIGYILKTDSVHFQVDFSKENIKMVKTIYTIDKEGKYYALVAIKYKPVINNSDIQKTKSKKQNVEIYFNLNGSRKWADMTKNNIGNMVAFTIDEQIYSLPNVNGEIKSGIALISGLGNETIAKKLSDSLNSSIPD